MMSEKRRRVVSKALKVIPFKIIPFKNAMRKVVFNQIYKKNLWAGDESISGKGSSMQETANIRKALAAMIKKYGVKVLVDAPCGDFYWMRHVDLKGVTYIGYDIVKEIIAKDVQQYGNKNVKFAVLDIVTTPVAKADIVMCRDCMVHLSNKHILTVLANFKKSGSRYMLATTFPNITENEDIPDGMWRRINLEKPPFNLPKPLQMINEGSLEDKNKSIGLWDLTKIQV